MLNKQQEKEDTDMCFTSAYLRHKGYEQSSSEQWWL